MKPLIVLLLSFIVSLASIVLFTGNINYALSGLIALSAMLLFTAFGHFKFAGGMAKMLPEKVPFKKGIILFTGLVEIAAAIGLLVPSLQRLTAWMLILFFILVLPANISAAMRSIDIQKNTSGGPGLGYLWFRIPLQVLFISWAYFFAIWL